MNNDVNATRWLTPPHLEHFNLLVEQKQFIIVFCLAAVLTALALTYIYSEKYEAGTQIFYRQEEVTLMKPMEQQAFGSAAPSTPFKVVSKTVDDIVHSWAILRPVVEDLKLYVENRVYEGPWWTRWYKKTKDWVKDCAKDLWMMLKHGRYIEEDPVNGAINGLSENLSVENKDSYVFTIGVRDKHPERAARIADAIAEHLVTFLRDQSVQAGRGKRQQLERLMDAKNKEVQGFHSAIEVFMAEKQLVSISDEIDNGMERLSQIEQSRVILRNEIDEKQTKLSAISHLLDRRGASGSRTYIQPEDKQRLESEKLSLQVELDGAQARYESIEQSVDQLTARLQELPGLELKLQQTRTELEGAKRDWVQLRDALQEAAVRESPGSSEAKVLHLAGVPSSPVTPIKVYHVGLAMGLSLLTAIALVFVFDYLNIRVFFHSLGVRGRGSAGSMPSPSQTRSR